MNSYYLYILLISFLATLVRSTFGFGESLIAVPLLLLFLPLETAVPLSVLLSVLIALIAVVQDHRKIHLNSAKWLVLSALPGIPLGLLILIYGHESLVKLCLGLLIMAYAFYSLKRKTGFYLATDSKPWLFLFGFLSGILGGAYGLNGPPLVVYGHLRRWSAPHFRATLQAYFLPASLLALIGFAFKGLLDTSVLIGFMVALPAAIPAVFLGRYLNGKLKGAVFFKYIYAGLILIGGLLIANCLKDFA